MRRSLILVVMHSMKNCTVALSLMFLVACTQPAEPIRQTVAQKTETVLPGKFQDLPLNIQNRILKLFDNELPASNIESFNSTDVIEESTSSRRIIFTLKENDMYFIYYEHGGIGLHNHLVGISPNNVEGDPDLNVSIDRTYEDLAQVRIALSKIEFSNSDEY